MQSAHPSDHSRRRPRVSASAGGRANVWAHNAQRTSRGPVGRYRRVTFSMASAGPSALATAPFFVVAVWIAPR